MKRLQFHQSYRRLSLASFLLIIGAVNAVMGGVSAHPVLMVLGLGVLGTGSWMIFLQQQRSSRSQRRRPFRATASTQRQFSEQDLQHVRLIRRRSPKRRKRKLF